MKVFLESRDFKRKISTKAKTIRELFKEQQLLTENFIVSKNSKIVTESEKIKNKDKLRLYPVISGG